MKQAQEPQSHIFLWILYFTILGLAFWITAAKIGWTLIMGGTE